MADAPTFGHGPFCDRCKRTRALCDRSSCATVREAAGILADRDKRYSARTWADWIDRSLRDTRLLPAVHLILAAGIPAIVFTLEPGDDVIATFAGAVQMRIP